MAATRTSGRGTHKKQRNRAKEWVGGEETASGTRGAHGLIFFYSCHNVRWSFLLHPLYPGGRCGVGAEPFFPLVPGEDLVEIVFNYYDERHQTSLENPSFMNAMNNIHMECYSFDLVYLAHWVSAGFLLFASCSCCNVCYAMPGYGACRGISLCIMLCCAVVCYVVLKPPP